MTRFLDIGIGDATVQVASAPQHDWFWDEVARGGWEQDTFKILQENVGEETLYIDIGAWIGPTVLCGGRLARRIVAVEPDPIAMSALLRNLDLNPEIKSKVSLHNHALAAENGVVELWSGMFGDSMTTCIPGRGVSKMTFLAMGADEFLDRALGDEQHVLIKIDVESAEFELVPALLSSLERRGVRADLYVSFHASILIDEARSMRQWAANLARNGQLLSKLADYGTIHTYDGQWRPITEHPGAQREFLSWMDTGGTDHSFFVKAHLAQE